MSDGPRTPEPRARASRGVRGLMLASLLADVGLGVPTVLLPTLLTNPLGGSPAVLGLIEGLAHVFARGGALAGAIVARRSRPRVGLSIGGYAVTAISSCLIGIATAVWQAGALRILGRATQGFRVAGVETLVGEADPKAASGPGSAWQVGR